MKLNYAIKNESRKLWAMYRSVSRFVFVCLVLFANFAAAQQIFVSAGTEFQINEGATVFSEVISSPNDSLHLAKIYINEGASIVHRETFETEKLSAKKAIVSETVKEQKLFASHEKVDDEVSSAYKKQKPIKFYKLLLRKTVLRQSLFLLRNRGKLRWLLLPSKNSKVWRMMRLQNSIFLFTKLRNLIFIL